MATRRNLTVGVTVNLEHYENLRLEVSGEVENDSDADELVRFLDHLLERMGRGDPATAEAVDSYRSRVFSFAPELSADKVPAVCHDTVCSLPAEILEDIAPATAGSAETPDAGKDTTAARKVPGPGHTGQETTVPVPAPVPAPVPPAVTGTTADMVCEDCGNPVTAAQAKMSRLFTSRTLCKGCMKKP